MTRTRTRAIAALATCALAGGTACWNGHNNKTYYVQSEGRFRLEIETGRTDVPGTHFLVDTATGDVWRLDARAATPRWVRIASGPEDVQPIAPRERIDLADAEEEEAE